ncbi:hypothetical protein SLS55_000673 [Diplodia seriata]|uniref:Cytochrome p450 n=1 Tax=Diplodia seriata TaxID=420778 RepID=A0ABR3CV03_9PEZI
MRVPTDIAVEEVPGPGFLARHPFLVLASPAVLWVLGLGIYRLFFHPIAKFPGPKLAGLTYWYETYHDFLRGGKYTEKISDLHDKYGEHLYHLFSQTLHVPRIAPITASLQGPIIRINPEELHVRDPKFIDTLYTYGSKRGISSWFTGPFE